MERQYSLLSNLAFVLRQMKRFARRSFRMIWLSIPLKVAGNLILFGSGIFGFAVYLSVLRVLPVWLLLLMTACTMVSFSFSGLGDKEHRKVDGARSTSIRKMSYLQDSSADPKFGKDIRLYAMYPWIEERFAILHRQVRSSYGRVEAKNFLSASITAGMGILIRQYSYEEYCRLFAVVFQDFQVFALPLGENVAASMHYDKEKVQRCLDRAGIGEWARSIFPTACPPAASATPSRCLRKADWCSRAAMRSFWPGRTGRMRGCGRRRPSGISDKKRKPVPAGQAAERAFVIRGGEWCAVPVRGRSVRFRREGGAWPTRRREW